jgi:ankyrin repeat protein
MIENGSDVHQGGDGPLMRAALNDERIPMLELLWDHGADVNARWAGHYPIIFAPCETLAPGALRWLIAHGADMHASSDGSNCLQMLVRTYARNPEGKHTCLEVFAEAGFSLPDTAPMAIHRGRIDLLAARLDREQELLDRRFREAEFFPAELGLQGGLHVAPLDGGTLLHLAVEYQEECVAQWLIDRGADVNARAAIDADGFGGHTPLFHTAVTLGRKEDTLARLLLRSAAEANARATFRKQLVDVGDPEKEKMREYHDVTPIGFARMFQEPQWVNETAIAAIREYGGQ